MTTLPDGYALRALAHDDLAAVQALLDACETADTGESCVHEMDLAVEACSPQFDLAHGAWLVSSPGGAPAAVGWVWTPRDGAAEVTADHYVHPDHRQTKVDAALVDVIEARAAVLVAGSPAADRLVLFADDAFPDCGADLRARDFRRAHDLYCMRADFDAQAPPSRVREWPAGIAVRPIRPDRDARACWATDEEAFCEHYLYQPMPFEEWRQHAFERDAFDASLWLVAWDADEVAGQVWGLPRGKEVYVEDLCVRRPWRGRGLALALLEEVFALLAQRGLPFVRLFVDAQNVTGAIRVYERAGMRIERRIGAYEKRLA